MEKELQEQLKKLLKCSDKNCQEGHYPLGMNENGEIEWGGCPNCVTIDGYFPRVDPYKLKSFIDQNFIGKEELREEIETKYGEYGKQTGSFGYQGIKMGIHSIQTEGDQMRDKLLELLK